MTYRHNWTATRGSRVGRTADNILTRKQPVAPPEAADVVEGSEEQHRRLRILHSEVLHAYFLGLFTDICEELAVRERAIGAELMQNFGEGSRRHWDLAEMVEERDLWDCCLC